MSVLYGLYEYTHDPVNHHMTLDVSALYASVSRFAWSIGLAWVTLTCLSGYGGKETAYLLYPTDVCIT